MKRLLLALCAILTAQHLVAQDTTWIQTLTFSDITKRRDWFQFPDGSQEHRKVLMYYTLKCDPATTQDGYDCGEWDYLSYSFVYDHTGVMDSNLQSHPQFLYGTQDLDSLHYTATPQFNTIESYEYFTVIDAVNSETAFTVGTASGSSEQSMGGHVRARSQFVWTAAELGAAGMTAGNIHRLAFDLTDHQTDLGRLTVSMKHTSTAVPTGFEGATTVVYDRVTPFPNGAGTYYLDLLTPFSWDGSSGLLVEFSYEAIPGSGLNLVSSATTADVSGVHANGTDNAIIFENAEYMELPLDGIDLGNEVTVSFWSYGNPDIQPANSFAFEAVNAAGQRVLNVHLPWSDGNVYWDAGEGSGYDRISKAATVQEYEGNWVHWAFTKNATNGRMRIYKNGILWHSGTNLNRAVGEIDRFVVGRAFGSANSHNGKMDEFQVWDVELDAATIAAWMNRRVDNTHPNHADLIAYYDFDQSDHQLVDRSGNGHTPVLMGAPRLESRSNAQYVMDATLTNQRPLLSFLQGDYVTHLDSAIFVTSVAVTPLTITEFAVQGHGIQPVGTSLAYEGSTFTYQADGLISTSPIPTDAVSYNGTLAYYQAPFEIIDRYEIARYITPYGIGLSLGPNGFTWVYDVTDYAHLLRDSVDILNGNQQELIDVKFAFIHGTPMAEVVELSRPWGQSESYSYGNLDNDISLAATDVAIHPDAERIRVKTRLTGHGHNSNTGSYPHCCEWKDNTHYLRVNGSQAAAWHIWQTHECAQNPVYPQGGTWPAAREGWCPGDVVKDNEFDITARVSGNSVNLDYDITPVPANNQGMAGGNYVIAMHVMQYGAANHALDAEVYDVISPNRWEYYSRINPYCDDARIVIRNAGETTLTSLTISYKVDGGQPLTYQWSGNLPYMEKEEVVLPISDPSFWTGHGNGKFIATVSAPNGLVDAYADNDSYTSRFNMPNVYDGNFIVRYKTNNYPHENYWQITDVDGNVVAERSNSDANTTYMDTMDLAPGCYTFNLYDSEDDGLSYWAWPNQGTGFCRFKENGGGYIQNFEAEFGGQITHGFSVGVLASVPETLTDRFIEVYPNPNEGQFTMEMSGFSGDFRIVVLNSLGQVVGDRTAMVSEFHEEQFDLRDAKGGLYFVRVMGDGLNETRRVVVN